MSIVERIPIYEGISNFDDIIKGSIIPKFISTAELLRNSSVVICEIHIQKIQI